MRVGVSILGSLFKFCTGERLERLVLKFEENECEKVDRLCELYCRCAAQPRADIFGRLQMSFWLQDFAPRNLAVREETDFFRFSK